MKAGPVETNTVEFALPAGETIQRTPEPQAAPAPVVQTVTAAPAPTGDGGAALPTDLDELARRLYGPLEARLKTELWLDRERAGLITEVRR